jgi:hypothetical protein
MINDSNILITLHYFLNLNENIYKHDKDIGKFKEVALILSIFYAKWCSRQFNQHIRFFVK